MQAAFSLVAAATVLAVGDAPARTPGRVDAREYLAGLVYQPEEVDQWLAERAFPFCKYDAGLGWLVRSMRRNDGAGGSIATYTYDGPEGARRLINAADRPGRINTFGDSFTQCDQVSNGETWQEQLAVHLGEPVRNYGAGGYSVYQAYLRMQRVERTLPSQLIVLNIYEDDHYWNLDSWRNIRVSKHPLFIEPTLPHLRVDLATGTCTEVPNPCPTPESVRRLADPAWVYERFKDDFILQIMLAHRNATRLTARPPPPESSASTPGSTRDGGFRQKRKPGTGVRRCSRRCMSSALSKNSPGARAAACSTSSPTATGPSSYQLLVEIGLYKSGRIWQP